MAARDLPAGHALGLDDIAVKVAGRRHPALRTRTATRPGDAPEFKQDEGFAFDDLDGAR